MVSIGEHAQRAVAHEPQAELGLGDTLADQRVRRRAVRLGGSDDCIELIAKPHLLAERRHAALEGKQSHCDLPAVAGGTDKTVGRAARVGEKGLVEFGIAVDLPDRANFNPGLVDRHHEEGEPLGPL